MSFRSSIFSFDTLSASLRPGRSVLLALCIVASMRIVLALSSSSMIALPGPTRGEMLRSILNVERFARNHANEPPQALLLGSSRIEYGLLEDVFAAECGLDSQRVLNLGLGGGSIYEALVLVRRTPELIGNGTLVVLGVDAWMFNEHRDDSIKPGFYRVASLRDRLRLCGRGDRAYALADYLLGFVSARRSAPQWLRGAWWLIDGQDDLSGRRTRVGWTEEGLHAMQTQARFQPKNAARSQMSSFAGIERAAAALGELHALCEQRAATLVLLVPPASDAYLTAVDALPGGEAAQRWFRHWLAGISKSYVVLRYERGADAGLAESDFVDWAHLTRDAAQRFTRRVASDLRAARRPALTRVSPR